jgi:hypothetical protein
VPLLDGTLPHWRAIGHIAKALGKTVVETRSDRDLTVSYLGAEERLAGLTIRAVMNGGIDLKKYEPKPPEESVGETKEGEGGRV